MKLDVHSPRFILFLLIGMIAGAIYGGISGTELPMAELIGKLFLNALKMMIVPLVGSSMILGVTQMGQVKKLGRLGAVTLFYYILTTLLAVTAGLILVNILEPGINRQIVSGAVHTGGRYSFLDVVLGIVPENIFAVMAKGEVLPLIFFSLFFGLVMNSLRDSTDQVLKFFEGLFEISMKMTQLIIVFAPIGIFGLVAARLGKAGGWGAFEEELTRLGMYVLTVISGLAVHSLLVLPLIYFLVVRKNPLDFVRKMGEALITAFSTASSSATLPLTMECAEKNAGIRQSTASFVLPLGATVNMDGTALYEAVAAMFIAQLYGIHLGFADQLVIVLTATLAAIGAAGIPEAGLVTMVLVLHSVGLPTEGIGAILAVDWFLDRIRTTVNVWGDSIGAAVVDRFN